MFKYLEFFYHWHSSQVTGGKRIPCIFVRLKLSRPDATILSHLTKIGCEKPKCTHTVSGQRHLPVRVSFRHFDIHMKGPGFSHLTHCPLGDMAMVLKIFFSNSLHRVVGRRFDIKLSSGEYHRTSLMRSHFFTEWLGVVRHQAITRVYVDPDLCRHMASLGHNEIKAKAHHFRSRARFLSLDRRKLRVSSDYAQPITGQVTEVTWPVIGWAQPVSCSE